MPKVQFLFHRILAAMLAFFSNLPRIVLYRIKQGIHKRITGSLQIAFCIGRQASIHLVALGKLHLGVYIHFFLLYKTGQRAHIHFLHAKSECRGAFLGVFGHQKQARSAYLAASSGDSQANWL